MVKTQNHVLMVLFQVQAMNARLRTETCFSRLPGPIFGRTAEQHSSCRDKRLFLFLLRNISTSFAFCKGNHYSPHSDGLILNYAGENTSKNARNRTRQSPTRPPPLARRRFAPNTLRKVGRRYGFRQTMILHPLIVSIQQQ